MPGMLPGMLSANSNPLEKQLGQAPRRAVDLIVIHCSATASGNPLRQGEPGEPGYLNAPQVINAWHAARGFKRSPAAVRAFSSLLPSIGYHYVIDLTGEVWSGRHLEEVGAHAANFNAHSVGICLVGGAEREALYTPAQWKSLQQVVAMLLTEYGIPCAAPKRTFNKAYALGYTMAVGVCGHRDLSPDTNGNGLVEPFEWLKTCPGFDVRAWLARGMQPEDKHIYEEKQA
jgi:N-acetyl-anhydromuramyl-L-alanine amidase AmpD